MPTKPVRGQRTKTNAKKKPKKLAMPGGNGKKKKRHA